MADSTDNARMIAHCLVDAEFEGVPGFLRNKVRDAYQLPDGRRLLISTDRQSAFDRVLAAVPHKAQRTRWSGALGAMSTRKPSSFSTTPRSSRTPRPTSRTECSCPERSTTRW